MDDLLVRRWRRFGHDRLYVRTPAGEQLGYWDCATGTAVLADGGDDATRAAFDAALAGHPDVVGAVIGLEATVADGEQVAAVPAPRAPAVAEEVAPPAAGARAVGHRRG